MLIDPEKEGPCLFKDPLGPRYFSLFASRFQEFSREDRHKGQGVKERCEQ
jgi:hypothetical protein